MGYYFDKDGTLVFAPVKQEPEAPEPQPEKGTLGHGYDAYLASRAGAAGGLLSSVAGIPGGVGALLGLNKDPGLQQAAQGFAGVAQAIRSKTPETPQGWEGSWTHDIAAGAGSMSAFLAGGFAGAGLKTLLMIPRFAVPTAMAALQNIEEQDTRMERAGVPKGVEARGKSIAAGGAIGATQVVSLLSFFRVLEKGARAVGSADKFAKLRSLAAPTTVPGAAAFIGTQEAFLEQFADVANDFVEKTVYNPEKAYFEQGLRPAVIGGIVGVFMGGMAAGARNAALRGLERSKEAQEADAAALDQAERVIEALADQESVITVEESTGNIHIGDVVIPKDSTRLDRLVHEATAPLRRPPPPPAPPVDPGVETKPDIEADFDFMDREQFLANRLGTTLESDDVFVRLEKKFGERAVPKTARERVELAYLRGERPDPTDSQLMFDELIEEVREGKNRLYQEISDTMESSDSELTYERVPAPRRTIKAYKLLATKKSRPGEYFPLFIGKKEAIPVGEWVRADNIPTKGFANRPGWHAVHFPPPHLAAKTEMADGTTRVLAEVEIAADTDWQTRAEESPTGDIRGEVPRGGFYRWKRPANQGGEWIIGGEMRVNRILDTREFQALVSGEGVARPTGPESMTPAEWRASRNISPELLDIAERVSDVHRGRRPKPIPGELRQLVEAGLAENIVEPDGHTVTALTESAREHLGHRRHVVTAIREGRPVSAEAVDAMEAQTSGLVSLLDEGGYERRGQVYTRDAAPRAPEKKTLFQIVEGARDRTGPVLLTRRTAAEGLQRIDPTDAEQRTRVPGAETRRRLNSPTTFRPRTYWTVEGGKAERAAAALPQEYTVVVDWKQLYDLAADSEGIAGKHTELNSMEAAVADAGYAGYYDGNAVDRFSTVALFDKTPVFQKSEVVNNRATIFVSPNVKENTTWDDALRGLVSEVQMVARTETKKDLIALGLNGKIQNALSNWVDGAESAIMIHLDGEVPLEVLQYVGALGGIRFNQKAVAVFRPNPKGKLLKMRALTSIDGSMEGLNKVREALGDSEYSLGIDGKTGKIEATAIVYDTGSQLKFMDTVAKLHGLGKFRVEVERGEGGLLGDDVTFDRQKAREIYEEFIRTQETLSDRGAERVAEAGIFRGLRESILDAGPVDGPYADAVAAASFAETGKAQIAYEEAILKGVEEGRFKEREARAWLDVWQSAAAFLAKSRGDLFDGIDDVYRHIGLIFRADDGNIEQRLAGSVFTHTLYQWWQKPPDPKSDPEGYRAYKNLVLEHVKEGAALQESFKNFYNRTAEHLRQYVNPERKFLAYNGKEIQLYDLFLTVLAGTSASSDPVANMLQGLSVMDVIMEGHDSLKKANDYVEFANAVKARIKLKQEKNPDYYLFKYPSMLKAPFFAVKHGRPMNEYNWDNYLEHFKVADVRVVEGDLTGTLESSKEGPRKTWSFFWNMRDPSRKNITLDFWMQRYLGLHYMPDLEFLATETEARDFVYSKPDTVEHLTPTGKRKLAPLERKTEEKWKAGEYKRYADMFREIADDIGWQPHEVQSSLWFWMKEKVVRGLQSEFAKRRNEFTSAQQTRIRDGLDKMRGSLDFIGALEGHPQTKRLYENISGKLLQNAETEIRGEINFGPGASAIMTFYRNGNLSTLVHEHLHFLRRLLPAQDLAKLEKKFGVKNGEWTVEQEEAFARSGELYLEKGTHPDVDLRAQFETIAQGLQQIYTGMREYFVGNEVLDRDTIQMFDSWFAPEENQRTRQLFQATRRTLETKNYGERADPRWESALERFQVDDQVKQAMRDVFYAHKGFRERRRMGQSWKETQELALRLVPDIERIAKAAKQGTVLNPEQTQALAEVMAGEFVDARESMERLADADNLSYNEKMALKLKVADHNNKIAMMYASFMGARSEAGRTLNAHKMIRHAIGAQDREFLNSAADLVGRNQTELARLYEQFKALDGDTLNQFKLMRKAHQPKFWDWARWYIYTNLLSGYVTQQRNFVGTAFNIISRGITSAAAEPSAIPHQIYGHYAGTIEGLRRAVHVLRHGVDLGHLERIEKNILREKKGLPPIPYSKTSKAFDVDRMEVSIPHVPDALTNVVGRVMDSVDTLMKSVAFSSEVHVRSYLKAKNEGLQGDALRDRVAEIANDPDIDMIEAGDELGRIAAFQEDPGYIAKALMRGKESIRGENRLAGLLLDMVLPFIRTPANILRQGLETTPAAFLMQRRKRGDFREQQIYKYHAALGSTMLLPIIYAAWAGDLTGDAPRDAAEREEFYGQGKLPNAIRLGNRWYSYYLFQPLSVPMAIIANAADAVREGADPAKKMDPFAILYQTLARSGSSFLNQSFLTGLMGVLEAIHDPSRYGTTRAARIISPVIPLTGLQRNIAQELDPIVRNAVGFRESVMTQVPGLSTRVAPRIDRFGQVIERPPMTLAIQHSEIKKDIVVAELARLDIGLRGGMPTFRYRDTLLEFGPEEETVIQQTRGLVVYNMLYDELNRTGYWNLTDERKAKRLERIIETGRRRVATRVRTAKLREGTVEGQPLRDRFGLQ